MNHQKMYKLTSIGRPLNPAYLTNKAVLIILPIVLLAGITLGWLEGLGTADSLVNGLRFALIAFAGWALARELAPDDQSTAFICMFLAVVAGTRVPDAGVLIVFATMGLVRLVNRSTGLPARMGDSLVLMLITFLVVYSTQSPFFALVAAIAFALDGILRDPVRRHWIFAVFSFIGMIVYMVDNDVTLGMLSAPDSLAEWLSFLFLVLFLFNIIRLPRPMSVSDIGAKRLSLKRVKGGMLVAALAVLQGINLVQDVIIIASIIAGICIGSVFRRAFSSPSPT